MAKGLFTSLEEIKFQYNYIQGNVEKAYDPNTRRHPQKHLIAKRQSKQVSKAFLIRTR